MPDNPEANHRLGVLADQRREYEVAARHYMTALQQKPSDPDLLNDIGYSFLLQGRAETARRYLEDALRAQPAHVRARANLALLDARQGAGAAASKPGTARLTAPDAAPATQRLAQRSGGSKQESRPDARSATAPKDAEAKSPSALAASASSDPGGVPEIRPAGAFSDVEPVAADGFPEVRPATPRAVFTGDLTVPELARSVPMTAARVPSTAQSTANPPTPGSSVPVPPAPAGDATELVTAAFGAVAELPAPDPIDLESVIRAAQLVGMNIGPGNPFPILGDESPAPRLQQAQATAAPSAAPPAVSPPIAASNGTAAPPPLPSTFDGFLSTAPDDWPAEFR